MKTDIKKHENGGAKSWIKTHLSDIIPVLGLILVLVFFHAVSGGKVFTKTNFNTLFNEAFSLLIVTYALIFVMAQGKNDMSLGGVVALAAALAAHASSISGNLVLPVALLVGLLCGLLNGLIVTELRIDSFIATIAMSFILKGFVELLLQSGVRSIPIKMMMLDAMLSFINHGSNIFVDAVDMTGTYEPLVYSRLKNVYDDAARFEKYFSKGKPCTDIGIYFNLHGKYDEETPPMDISESKHISRAIPHLDSSINVSETLQRAHIPYSVYTSFHPEQWGKAKMLIVSDAPNMSKENMSELKAYVEDGGIAYISGHSAQPLVEEIFGGKITGRTDETITYIAPEDEVASLFGEYSRKYPLTVYNSAYILEGATNGKVLAKLTLPYSLQASSFLVCADLELQVEADPNDPRNESASMHSDPPGIATDYPAMMEAEVGKGKIIWVCAPFENTSLTQPRKVFTSFVKKYVPEMRFASDDTPYVVEYQLWEDEEGKYLSAINLQYADEVLPVFDFNICIRTEKPAKITRVSDGREMGFEYSDGKLVLHIDRLDLYEMFDIQI